MGFQVDIPRFIYSPPQETGDAMVFGKDPVYSIGCYRDRSIQDAYNSSIQPNINQGVPMLINEWTDFRGSSIIHSKYTNQGWLTEIYIIPGKRGAYGIVMAHSFPNLSGEQKAHQNAAHMIFSLHLASLRDSFEETDITVTGGYSGAPSYGGYGEPEMGKGTEEMLKFRAGTGIDPWE